MNKKEKTLYLSYIIITMLILKSTLINSENIIHIIGDSHALASFSNINLINRFHVRTQEISYFWYKNNAGKVLLYPFVIDRLGPRTMHKVGRDGLDFLNLEKFNVKDNDIVVFSFGEIDVRFHIGKQRDEKEREFDDIIETLVINYINTIVQNRELYSNLYCIVFAVLPPTNIASEPSYPIYGSLEDRINVTEKLNARLKEECYKNNIVVLDVYDLYATEQGYLNPELSDGKVHIKKEFNRQAKLRLIELINQTWPNLSIGLSLEKLIDEEINRHQSNLSSSEALME